eukprot:6189926-Pleurochrysis_carterae.AAC.1
MSFSKLKMQASDFQPREQRPLPPTARLLRNAMDGLLDSTYARAPVGSVGSIYRRGVAVDYLLAVLERSTSFARGGDLRRRHG